jgi:alkyldihydroxyacetonephosphate synthase
MRWWGWGEESHPPALPGHALEQLRDELGLPAGARGERVRELDAVGLPDSALGEGARAALERATGAGWVRDDRESRIRHAAGRGLPDLLRLRRGDAEPAPDAVVGPGGDAELRAVLDACAEHRVAVVPFGGGTSVVGGVEPLRGGCDAVVALDLRRLTAVEVDERSLLATAGAGLRLPEFEARLARAGVTLGHFPQSFEYATVGGCVATRSAGQASTGYGRIDELVRGVRMAAPAGELALPALPASAAGPDLRELVVGSEGTLGVIAAATLAVRPAPAVRRYEGVVFSSFADGAEALRACAQRHAAPDVARLSDEEETRLTLTLAGESRATRAMALYLRARGIRGGCIAIVGWEGAGQHVRRRRARSLAILRHAGGVALGAAPGRAWARGRFEGPYLRDDLLDHGVLVETLETAHRWSRLDELYRAVGHALRSALRARGTPPLVLCHVSHLYETGASLYFTFLARADAGAELEQWRAAKEAASEAIVAAGGTITHHHAIGRDHARWLGAETGALGLEALRAAKERLDPAGIMNPGKLLPD